MNSLPYIVLDAHTVGPTVAYVTYLDYWIIGLLYIDRLSHTLINNFILIWISDGLHIRHVVLFWRRRGLFMTVTFSIKIMILVLTWMANKHAYVRSPRTSIICQIRRIMCQKSDQDQLSLS